MAPRAFFSGSFEASLPTAILSWNWSQKAHPWPICGELRGQRHPEDRMSALAGKSRPICKSAGSYRALGRLSSIFLMRLETCIGTTLMKKIEQSRRVDGQKHQHASSRSGCMAQLPRPSDPACPGPAEEQKCQLPLPALYLRKGERRRANETAEEAKMHRMTPVMNSSSVTCRRLL